MASYKQAQRVRGGTSRVKAVHDIEQRLADLFYRSTWSVTRKQSGLTFDLHGYVNGRNVVILQIFYSDNTSDQIDGVEVYRQATTSALISETLNAIPE